MSSSATPAQSTQRLAAIVAFALVYVFWGSTYLAIRIAVEHLSPAMMGGLRFTTAGLLMLGFRVARGHRIRVGRRDLMRLAIVGFLLLVSSNVVMGWGELYVASGLAALLVAVTPLWFLILERITHSADRLSRRGIAGIALGLLGVAVLLWPDIANSGQAGFGPRQLFGSMLVLCASISWATGSILSRRWQMPIDLYAASGWQMLFGGLFGGTIALLLGDLHHTNWAGAKSSLWAVVYLIVAGSMVGFTAYVWLLKNVPIAKMSTYAYVNPIVALLLGYFLHGERMDVYMLAGAAVVIVSVILVTAAKVQHARREDEGLAAEIEPGGD
jgi:drug/metabolite transporter (DMT)-like permease